MPTPALTVTHVMREAGGLDSPAMKLTAFERRILELRASGWHRRDIARVLNRSPQTISNSMTVAKEKLGATSLIAAAVILATGDGRVTTDLTRDLTRQSPES